MGNAEILYHTLQLSAELDELHKLISTMDLPVQKRDSFDEQCILLEEYLENNDFRVNYRRMKKINMITGLFAIPFLIVVIGLYISGKFKADSNFISYIFNNMWIIYVLGVSLVALFITAVYFYALRRNLYYKIYPKLKQGLQNLNAK